VNNGPLYVHGMGHFHPENVIDNRFLEELDIGTNDEWIVERVGIHERRTVLPLDYIRRTRNADLRAAQEAALYTVADTGKRAAKMAIERAGIRSSDIGMVVAGSSCPDIHAPAEACRVAAALEIEAPAFDVNSACSTFGAQVHLLASMRGLPPYVLVVQGEHTTRAINYSDRATCVLFGDGAAAAVVSTGVPARAKITQTTLTSSPAGWNQVSIHRFRHLEQEGGAVQRFAIEKTLGCVQAMLPSARAHVRDTGGTVRFVGHQANLLVLEGAVRRASLAPAEHWHNVRVRGNTASAGAPAVLSEHWDELGKGDAVLVAVVGAGLTWSSFRLDVD
jgi:3-oxoacyl-[acyl-carrier-protein] synthase-3